MCQLPLSLFCNQPQYYLGSCYSPQYHSIEIGFIPGYISLPPEITFPQVVFEEATVYSTYNLWYQFIEVKKT